MCIKNVFRRFGAFVAALVLCFALSVPALADEVLNGNVTFYYLWMGRTATYASGLSGGSVSLNGSSQPITPSANNAPAGFAYILAGSNLFPAGSAIGIYLSSYYEASDGFTQSKKPAVSDFAIGSNTSSTGYSFKSVSSVSTFSPSSSANSKSDGCTIIARLENGVGDPQLNWILINSSASNANSGSLNSFKPSWYVVPVSTWNNTSLLRWVVTNFRVVSTSSNAELDALESMASEIANQSQILSQFYGDIVAVCNQIYNRLGDLQAAQEEANRLFSNVISLLNTTNSKLEAINIAMSTYFELLINQLKQEGIDTRTAIADAEARLELYLKPMIDYFNELEEQTGESASTLPQHKTDIDGFNNEGFGIDSDGQTGLAAILPIMSAFSFIFSILGIFIGLGVLGVIIKRGAS